jgi:hypothetical protein
MVLPIGSHGARILPSLQPFTENSSSDPSTTDLVGIRLAATSALALGGSPSAVAAG